MTTLHRALVSVCLLLGATTAQAASTLPLEAGTYIDGGAQATCAGTANAATLYFDGKSLQGPHLEMCKTAIRQVARDGKTFETQSLCNEQDKDGHPMQQKELRTIRVADRTHFQELIANAAPRDFHRCGPYPAH